jgi:hypothetical protein
MVFETPYLSLLVKHIIYLWNRVVINNVLDGTVGTGLLSQSLYTDDPLILRRAKLGLKIQCERYSIYFCPIYIFSSANIK